MTHEELLATINHEIIGNCQKCKTCMPWVALRAVVELHKPGRTAMMTGEVVCDACDAGDNYYSKFYPCPTIQAIEKELK